MAGAVLEPVVIRGIVMRLYSRGDAAFANPEIYEFLEAEGMGYAIRPTNRVLQDKIGSLLVERGCVIDMIRNEDLAQNLNKLHAYLGV
jgi:hypothetical protein